MENHIKYSKGVCWIGDCRIPFVDGSENTTRGQYENKVQVGIMAERPNIKFVGSFDDSAKQGRFTPNLLVCDDMLNDGSVSKSGVYDNTKGKTNGFHATSRDIVGERKDIGGFSDKGTNSRYYDLDLWFDNMLNKL